MNLLGTKITIFGFLWIISGILSRAQGGHIVFYTPFCSKSSVITFPTLANALVDKGHKVTVVTGWPLKNFSPEVQQVHVETGFSELNDRFSEISLDSGKNTRCKILCNF